MIYHCDIEATGLLDEPDLKLHCLSTLCGGSTYTYTDDAEIFFRICIQGGDTLVFHNGFGYDFPALIKMGVISDYSVLPDSITLMDGTVKNVQLIDTLALSRSWYPDLQGGHGLEAYTKRLGTFKPEIKDWKGLPIEEYVSRCEADVDNTEKVFEYLMDKLGVDYE